MTRVRVLCIALALATMCSASSRAQETSRPSPQLGLRERVLTLEKEVSAGFGGGLKVVAAPRGSVQISAWKERRVAVQARAEMHAPTEADLDMLATIVGFSLDPDATDVVIKTTGPHDKRVLKTVKNFPGELKKMPWRVDYVIWVPEFTALDVSVDDGETLVDGVNGIITITSLHGPIELRNVEGAVDVASGDGDVSVHVANKSWRGGNLSVKVARGDIFLRVPRGFAAVMTASALGGITLIDGTAKPLGTSIRSEFGPGGSDMSLTAAIGRLVINVAESERVEPPSSSDPSPAEQ